MMKDKVGDVEDRLEIDEIWVRGMMTVGVVCWTLAAILSYATGVMEAFFGFGVIAIFSLGVLLVGLYSERIAAFALSVGTIATMAWGITQGWDMGVWLTMGITLFIPAVITAGLYFFAEHEEEVIEHEEAGVPTKAAHA